MSLVEYLVLEAEHELMSRVQSGEEFICRDLFIGVRWDKIDSETRRQVGASFFLKNGNGGKGIITKVRKTNSNQQVYKKL